MDTLQKKESKQQYRFFAFISYSSKDKAWGKKLQAKLERYRLPARLRKRHDDAPDRAYPIFRDDTDLAGFKVRASLERELEESQYLIVICSPQSAASDWVNAEIQYFIDHGKEDKILPLIVEGIPHSGDPKTECFPPALRNMKEDPLGVDVTALGWRKAYLRLVSALLNVQYDELVMRDAHRRMRNGILEGIGAAVLAVVMGCLIWYNTEHSKYYNAYTYQYEIPVGIQELSKKDRAAMNDCYRITTLRGKVIRLENVNSLGVAVDPVITTAMTDYPIQEFQYDDSGELVSVLQKDTTGMEISRKLLTTNRETNEIAIDFRTPSNKLDAQALSADMSEFLIGDREQDSKSEITRQRNTYDENGFLIRSLYQRDNLGTPACDSNGVYGKTYEYDDRGLILRIINLDEKGTLYNCKYGWACQEFRYDEKGNLIFDQYYDSDGKKARGKDGRSATRAEFDTHGNPIRLERLDESGQLIYGSDGFAVGTYQFNEDGFLTNQKHFDVDGNPVYTTDGYHEMRCAYDASGRMCGFSFYDTEGAPIYSPTFFCSSMQRVLDQDGRVLESQYFDVQGNPTCDRESGAYRIRYTYDTYGNHNKTEYLDAQGQLTMSKYGYAAWCATRDREGRILREECLDVNRNLVVCSDGYAIFTRSYDTFGNTTGYRVFDENEEPCYYADGYSYMEREYENGKLVSETYFDVDGSPMLDYGYHEVRMDYDERGNNIRRSYFDTEGNPTNCEDGYAAIARQYDNYGNVTQESWFDTQGNPIPDPDCGAYYIRYTYNENGYHERTEYLDAQGVLAKNKTGYAVQHLLLDRLGRILREENLDEAGNFVLRNDGYAIGEGSYDPFGNRTVISVFDENGEPCYHTAGFSRVENVYENGKKVSQKYFDVDGSPMLIDGYHEIRYDYDDMGNEIRRSYFDTEGNPVNGTNGYAIVEKQYDSYGYVIEERYFDTLGNPTMSKNGFAVRCVTRDHQGRILQEEKLDDAGNLIKRVLYDSQGVKTGEEELDKNGNLARLTIGTDHQGTVKYFDPVDGSPILVDGYHEVHYEEDESGRIICMTFFDLEGNLTNGTIGCAIVETDYDSSGNTSQERYYTADHRLSQRIFYDSEGEKIGKESFDQWNQWVRYEYENGRTVSSKYLDEDGNPMMCRFGFYEIRYSRDEKGNTIRETCYDTEGNLINNSGGFAILERDYDESGNEIETRKYTADHQLLG